MIIITFKKKKSLGVPKSRVLLDTTDIYDQDDSNHSPDSLPKTFGNTSSFPSVDLIHLIGFR